MRKQLLAVTFFTFVAQGVGFLKLWLIARLFGVGPVLDGYYLAMVPSTLIVGIVGGVVQTGFFPLRAEANGSSSADAADYFERIVLAGTLVLGFLLALLFLYPGSLLADWVVGSGASPRMKETLHFVWPFAAILVFLGAVGESVGYQLAARERYPLVSLAAVANALVGVGLLLTWPEGGVFNLILGTVSGMALQVAICMYVLYRSGFRFVKQVPSLSEIRRGWGRLIRVGAWILPGSVFSNLTMALPSMILARFGDGAVSAFGYAYRLHSFLVQGLVVAGAPVILARFSTLVACGNWAGIRAILLKAILFSLLLGSVVTLCVVMIGADALSLLFNGRFDAASSERVARHWVWLSAGLGGAILGNVFAKLWQARRMAHWMSFLAGTGLIVFLGVVFLFRGGMGEEAVPLALSLSTYAVIAIGWRSVKMRQATSERWDGE